MYKLYGLQFTPHALLGPIVLDGIYQGAYPARDIQVSDPWLFVLTRLGIDCRGRVSARGGPELYAHRVSGHLVLPFAARTQS